MRIRDSEVPRHAVHKDASDIASRTFDLEFAHDEPSTSRSTGATNCDGVAGQHTGDTACADNPIVAGDFGPAAVGRSETFKFCFHAEAEFHSTTGIWRMGRGSLSRIGVNADTLDCGAPRSPRGRRCRASADRSWYFRTIHPSSMRLTLYRISFVWRENTFCFIVAQCPLYRGGFR
ncbi:hypothetical protein NSERUTF1_4599 [Nocardia seriolae]|nr:hypothetical protein NSERUTF1_4599 [Nocardia seriolae]